ncbi:MAG TPA: hypothetical protein PKG54_03740 [Phycisphaerae bacterium]|jgi:hypothetical protein|nr:hypothetical protein [Phycisphaerae bacterium]HOB73619.1 hypothetical protein [Phycisphaerae bacterium]HOJ54776.1 hypothetical protein [Phycisphaerae bacterium]HOL25872.1 hypothetical protein [Phycisphaerae bacterium]HPP21196.1 hypothetical protein [Phycisphaerae bacterium]
MDHSQDAASPQKRPRRVRRWIILALVLALAVWFGRFAYLRITLRPTPRPEYWLAQRDALNPLPAGALTFAEVEARLDDRPWETNARPGAGHWRYDRGPADNSYEPLYADANASREFQKVEFQKARAAVIEAVHKGWQADPNTGMRIYGFYGGYTHWGGALIRHARWSREQAAAGRNDEDGASSLTAAREDWLAVLRMGLHLQRERRSVSAHMWTHIEERLADDVMQAARDSLLVLDARALASEVDAHRLKVDRPSQYFEGDRLALHEELEQVYVREGGNWIDVSAMVSRRAPSWWGRTIQAPSRIWNLTSPVFHTFEEASAYVDSLFESLDRPGNVGEIQRFGFSYGLHRYSTAWRVQDTLRRIQFSHTLMDAALTVLALRIYHDRNGRYPERLEELVPDYLPRLPLQYRDGKLLEYRRTTTGYEIRGVAPPLYREEPWGRPPEPAYDQAVLTPEGFQEVQP